MTALVHCDRCGFNVEPYDARQPAEYDETHCETCKICEDNPQVAEAYRRGFNAGLDRLAEAVTRIVKDSNLRRR